MISMDKEYRTRDGRKDCWMLDALRELVDFGSSTNYRHQDRSMKAHENAIEILERHGG